MSDVFISYARSTEAQARQIAEALRALGYGVWRDDELPAHRAYAEVIEERLKTAKAVVVVWSAEAVKSQWVFSEANRAREDGKLVQLTLDTARLPMPFDTIQCADLIGWAGDLKAQGWRKVVASVGDLAGPMADVARPVAEAQLPLPSKPSIAVLPFANLSNDPDQDYFADGMMDEIVTALTRNRLIFVIASGSTGSFKGKAVSPQDVGRQLGVRYVLEGSVRKAADRVRIAVKLIDADDGAQIWAERFDDTLEDVFALQDRVALSVAGIIEPTLQDAEVRRVAKRPTENMGGYDLYLRALTLFWVFGKDEMAEALSLLERAIALDADFGIALALASTAVRISADFGWLDDADAGRAKAMDYASRGLRHAGDDARALAHIASALLGQERTRSHAAEVVERALKLNPGCAYAWAVSGMLKSRMGEVEVALDHLATALRLDPLSPVSRLSRYWIGVSLLQQHRFAEAIVPFEEAAQLTSVSFRNALLAACLAHLGRMDEAREALRRFRIESFGPPEQLAPMVFWRPEAAKLFLDGIALADGKTPTEAAAGA